jgi:Mrp family chromosome partitioning ATPase
MVRSIDDASALGLPVLGSISGFDPKPGARLPGAAYPEALEAYRRLTDVIRAPDFHLRGRSIVVTSAEPGAGKSTTAKNLATLLTANGKVILVDADLNRVARRRPGDGTSSSGFAGLLVNQLLRPDNALVHTMNPRLKLLPAGSTKGSADDLFKLPGLPRVVETLSVMADHVIFDVATVTPGLLQLTRNTDVTLIVLGSGSTGRRQASRAIATLREANTGLLGIVLNRAPVVIEKPITEPQGVLAEAVTAPTVVPDQRLEIAVDDLLNDLEAALRLIRDIRQAGTAEEEAVEEEDAELVTMDR